MKTTLLLAGACVLLVSCGREEKRYALAAGSNPNSNTMYKIDTVTGETWLLASIYVPDPKPLPGTYYSYSYQGWSKIKDLESARKDAEKAAPKYFEELRARDEEAKEKARKAEDDAKK